MKKVIAIIALSILTFLSHAQEKKTYWDNGNLKSISNFDENGQKTGEWNQYYQTGELKVDGFYKKGKKEGTWYENYYNGERKKRTHYRNGLITEKNTYYENGRQMVSGSFDDNEKKHGVWEQYYDNWQHKMKGEYSHGKKHNQWKYYTKESKLYKVENYNLGVLTSKWTEETYDIENRIEHVVDVAKDTVTGVVEEVVDVTENANSEQVEVISDPDAVGSVNIASEVVESKSYYGNRLNGEWKFYNEKGKCIEIGNYKDDQKEGKWAYYYNNDQLKKEELWTKGRLMEITSHFNNKGESIKRGTLKYGYGTVLDYHTDGVVTTLD